MSDQHCERCAAVLKGAPADDDNDQHARFCWTCGAPYLTDRQGTVIPGSFGPHNFSPAAGRTE